MSHPFILPTVALITVAIVLPWVVESWLWRYRRSTLPPLRERLGRHPISHEQRARGLRTYRGWVWAGVALIVGGVALLWWFEQRQLIADGYGIVMAVIASGFLAWTIGAGISVVRAMDPPDGPARRMPPPRERDVAPWPPLDREP